VRTGALEDDFTNVEHSRPFVLQTRHVQHICIAFTARLPPAATKSLRAAATAMRLLHPTPAVCGAPTRVARDAIRAAEPYDRGLYAGPFGYVSAHGSEFCVAIRSALLLGSTAHLYGGAGVVRGSIAAAEWDEVHFKMRPFLSLFPAPSSLVRRALLRYAWLRNLFVEELLQLAVAAWQTVSCSSSRSLPGRAVSLPRALLFAVKVSRPYFWLVTIWLYLLPTGQYYHLWSQARFWAGLLYAALPLNLLCYLMNDLADVDVDVDNPRKGGVLYGVVAHAAALRTAVPTAVLAQLPFLAAFAVWCGALQTLGWFGAVFAVNYVYNFGPRVSSRYAPLDLFCPCGYLLVIPLSCALNGLPSPSVPTWVHTVFFVVRSQLWIQTFDIESDRRAGRRNTAVLLGLQRSQLLLGALLLLELAFVCTSFADWGLQSFSAVSLCLLSLQVYLGPQTAAPSPRAIGTIFAVLGLGGYGLLTHVWLMGSFMPEDQRCALQPAFIPDPSCRK